jgi:hypothetical protein
MFNPLHYLKYDSLTPPAKPLRRGGVSISCASHTSRNLLPGVVIEPIKIAISYDTRDTWNSLIYACGSIFHTNQGRQWLESWAKNPWQLDCAAELPSITRDGSLSRIGECTPPPFNNLYMEQEWTALGPDHGIVKGQWNYPNSSYILSFPFLPVAFGTFDMMIMVEGIPRFILSDRDWSTLIDIAMSTIRRSRIDPKSGNIAKVVLDQLLRLFPFLFDASPRAIMLTIIYCHK